jgi:hypothetical protein
MEPVQQPNDQTYGAAELKDGGSDLAANPSALSRTRGV